MALKDVLKPDLIKFNLHSSEKNAAIAELAGTLFDRGYITNLHAYIDAVMKREEIASTGLGMGIAIPHGKSPAVKTPCVAFGRNDGGIEYAADDGQPVYLMFLIAVPESSADEHLRILADISRKLIHEEVRERLKHAVSAESVYEALGTAVTAV